MSPSLALMALVTVAFVNLASTEEGMGLCYRCPLHHFANNEGSVYDWVKSFLQEIRQRCPGLKTKPKVTKPPKTSTYTNAKVSTTTADPPTTTTDPPTTFTNRPTTTTNPPTTTTDPPTTTMDPPTTTTDPPTTTTNRPITTTNPPTTTSDDPPTTTTDPPTTTSDPPTTTTNPPTATTDPPTTTSNRPITTTNPPTTTTDPPTTTTNPPTTTTKAPTTLIAPTPPLGAAADCQALLDDGQTVSGVYTIYPSKYPGGIEVRCDMTTDSKAWIVFQRRVDGTVNFTRSWAEYRDGFGDKEGEFWLGNEILRRLTEPVEGEQEWQMRVDLDHVRDGGISGELYALYDQFLITGELYNLSLVKNTTYYIGDSLSLPQAGKGHLFTTYDNDNDEDTAMNCADTLKGGWWFDNCGTKDSSITGLVYSNLNGEYGMNMTNLAFVRGIVWSKYAGQAFTKSEMKMRRVT